MESIDRYLFEDIQTAKKIKENPDYYDRLQAAYNIVQDLNIITKLQYYIYATVIDALENIPYSDIQSFKRFQIKEYYEYVQEKMKKPNRLNFNIKK